MQGMFGGPAAAIAAGNLMRSARMPKTPVVRAEVPAAAVIVPAKRRAASRKRAPKFEQASAFLRENPNATHETVASACRISRAYAVEIRTKIGLPNGRERRKKALLDALRSDPNFNAATYAKNVRLTLYTVYLMLRQLKAEKSVRRVVRYEVIDA